MAQGKWLEHVMNTAYVPIFIFYSKLAYKSHVVYIFRSIHPLLPHPSVLPSERHWFPGRRYSWFNLSPREPQLKGTNARISMQLQPSVLYLLSQQKNSRYLITVRVIVSLLKTCVNLLKAGILLALPHLPRLEWGIHSPFFFLHCHFTISFLFACAANIRITATATWVIQLGDILVLFCWKEEFLYARCRIMLPFLCLLFLVRSLEARAVVSLWPGVRLC